VAAAFVHAVDVLGIKEMCSADSLSGCFCVAGNGYKVDVVGHQTIAENVKAEPLGLLFENFEINRAVIINEENILLIIATLGNMVRHTL
jgi:hypothetical protein